ncbi:hypothetical protein LR48_Vigan10g276700 [Vigna angularis]|uniref:Uncharacterized protein n=1 Tax=Phaseolus angularis TaxID=3914 RepID=A0A0L9VPA2_PHAAN|nr:hypothetical protein LR48_Vigan10g276700 [Vigna angularis]
MPEHSILSHRGFLVSRTACQSWGKGVIVRIDNFIWKYVVGFQSKGLKAHKGISGFNKIDIYNSFLKSPDMIGKCDSFSIENLIKKESLCAYVITWILLPREKVKILFKDEYLPGTDEVNPVNVDTSKYKFKPQTRFEEFVDEIFNRLDEKMAMLQRSFTEMHRKIDYALRINAFGDTSVYDSESEKNNADEKVVESSETE